MAVVWAIKEDERYLGVWGRLSRSLFYRGGNLQLCAHKKTAERVVHFVLPHSSEIY
jgi:hypothetical protein